MLTFKTELMGFDDALVTVRRCEERVPTGGLDEELLRLARTGRRITVDPFGLERPESTEMGILLRAVRRARAAGGRVRVTSGEPRVRRILEITGFNRLFGCL